LKNDVNVPSKSNKQKKLRKKKLFFVGVSKVPDEKSRIRSRSLSVIRATDTEQWYPRMDHQNDIGAKLTLSRWEISRERSLSTSCAASSYHWYTVLLNTGLLKGR
jgi:hypothetical protein